MRMWDSHDDVYITCNASKTSGELWVFVLYILIPIEVQSSGALGAPPVI